MQLSSADKNGIILAVTMLGIALLAHCICRLKLTYNRMAGAIVDPDALMLDEVKPSASNN